jgi:hypothetical protein
MAVEEGRGRIEELWSRWLADGKLTPDEQESLIGALADDAAVRSELLGDQRIEGALCALGRSASDGHSFARRFAERVAAERDGRGFVSSVERQLAARARPPASKRLTWLLLPAAAAALVLVFALQRRGPAPSPVAPVASEGPTDVTARPFPAPPRPAAIARIESASGAVFLDGARGLEARPGTWLLSGWGLATSGPGSRVVLVFPDRTSLALAGDTALLQIGERTSEGRGKEAFLARGKLTAEVSPQPPGRPLLLTTPQAQATVVGTRFSLTVDRRATRLDVEEGGVQLGRMTGGPPTLVRGTQHALVSDDDAGTAPVRAQARGVALLLVGNLTLVYDDERVKHRLESLGFEVRVRGVGPPDPVELRQVSIVLVSSSVFSLDLNTLYRDVPVPVMIWEPSLYDDFGMTGPEENHGCGVAAGVGELLIKTPTHPIAAGLDGTVSVITNGKNLHHIWMTYGTPGPGAAWVATWPGLPNRAVLFSYERGAPMPGLPAAPGRRVGFFFYDDGRLHLTDAGWALFDAAVNWAAER